MVSSFFHSLPANEPIKGFDKLMYTVHFYTATHKQWLRDKTKTAISIGLAVSDKNEACSVLKPSAASDGKWKCSDIKESGLKTCEYLRGYP